MKVAQLIEVLQKMNPAAEVVTHANNHHSRVGDSVRVGHGNYAGDVVVVIGNWGVWNIENQSGSWLQFADTSFAVLSYGEDKGSVIKQRHVAVPESRVPQTTLKVVPAHMKLETEP